MTLLKNATTTKKSLSQIQHPLTLKAQKKLGMEGTCFNIIKAINYKPITNIVLNVEKLKLFLLKTGMKQGI
jgi:hypothetical protein